MKGKVALVTGASRNIGAAIALELGRRGCAVAVNYLENRDLADAVAAKVEEAGGRALALGADVRDRAAVRGMVERAADAFGGIDILVNNARSRHTARPFLELDWEGDMRPQIEVHLGGAFHCCQEAVPLMEARGGGAIVNVLSWVFRSAMPGAHTYGPAKAALRNFTMNLAAELGPKGIRVNSVSPGTTESPGRRSRLSEEVRERRLGEIPMRRFGAPGEVADSVAFLCSDAARFVTGADLPVTGGWGQTF